MNAAGNGANAIGFPLISSRNFSEYIFFLAVTGDAVFYSLQVDVTYSSADYQYSVILQQENSAEFIAMQERVCSQVGV